MFVAEVAPKPRSEKSNKIYSQAIDICLDRRYTLDTALVGKYLVT